MAKAKKITKSDNVETVEEVTIDVPKKSAKKEEEVSIVVEPLVEEKEEEEVTIDTSEMVKPQKMVRIKVKEKFKCFIGEWYYFEKNKVYSVPEHVKTTLMQRGKLLPM